MENNITIPLGDLKILDFTHLLPGPYGTMLLADMGADIIKIENFNNPDITRFIPPLTDNMSALYAHLNRGKKSLAIDLKKEQGRKIIYELMQDYDIIVEQFRPGVMSKLGLGYDDLQKINNSIIYCSLTGYGQTGSYSGKAGHDINYLALSGVESFSGRKNLGPALSGIQIADICGGSKNLVIGVLVAYINRIKTGKGDYIDISMTDSVFSMTVFSGAGFLADNSKVPEMESEMLNGGSIYDFYCTADNRYLSVGPVEPKFFKEFCRILECEDLSDQGIMANLSVPDAKERIASIIKSKSLEYWRSKFKSIDACVEPVLNLKEVCESDLVNEREMTINVADVNGNRLKQLGNPIKFKSGHYFSSSAGVPLGYNNLDILTSLGYSTNQISDLKNKRVL